MKKPLWTVMWVGGFVFLVAHAALSSDAPKLASSIKDYGLKEYHYLSKTLPHREENPWTLICQLPHNSQFQHWIEVEAPAGKVITFDSSNLLAKWKQPVQKYTTMAGLQTHETRGWTSGEGAVYVIPAGVTVKAVKYRETGYNTEFVGVFECNDEDYNILWRKATRTCYLCMRNHFMDCPDRERTPLCLGDVCVQMEQVFYAFDTASHQLAKESILKNPRYTHITGQNLAFAGESGTWFYYLCTGDLKTIETQYPNLKKYLDGWALGPDGLIIHLGNTRTAWDWGDWGSPSIDRRAIQCCQYYATLNTCRKMALALGKSEDLPAMDSKLKSIKENFDKVFWKGGYYQSGDVKYPDERANALAIVAGLADESKWKAIYDNVLSKKLNPKWEGGNTYNASSYFERWVMEALCMMGKEEFALLRMYDRYQDQINVHTTTLWEHFGRWFQTQFDPASTQNHGWNSPNTILSRYIAGIAPETAGWSTYHVLPKEAFLTSIRAVVLTVKGPIAVDLRKSASRYCLDLDSPSDTKAVVGIPKGSFSKLNSVTVNGTTVWKDGFKDGVVGIAWSGEDEKYLKFTVAPGKWAFLADGVLAISSAKPPHPARQETIALDKRAWKVSASVTHTGPSYSYKFDKKKGGSASDAADGDYWTFWSTGKPQSPGQWFQIDLGQKQAFDRIVLENGWAPYDCPKSYKLYVSDDGNDWGQAVASGNGSHSITEIRFPLQNRRYVKLEQTGSHSTYWWSISEVDIYRDVRVPEAAKEK